MKTKLFNNKGITLVALVITIILLLILAGITILSLTGSGLFENAKLAEQKSKNAQEKEDGILGDYENKIGEYIDSDRANSSNEWKLWKSGVGYISEENTMDLPETYSELLIEVSKMGDSVLSYSFNICKDMLLEEQYKIYLQGYQYSGSHETGVQIRIKRDCVYLRLYYHCSENYLSTGTMTVYYR